MTALAAVEPRPTEPTPAEVGEWPGIWSATSRFTGWTITAHPDHPEDAVASARKLAETVGRPVTVAGLVVRP